MTHNSLSVVSVRMAGGTDPLVLVDGVPRKMNDIDVDEIETFSILKDAAATAVYGAEGANGVVLITSKRGKSQKTVVSMSAEYGYSTPLRLPNLMSSYDYLSLYNEATGTATVTRAPTIQHR